MNQPSTKFTAAGTFATESPLHDLEAIIRSRTPLIAVESNEEPQIVSLVRQIGAKRQCRVLRWTVTEGLQAFEPTDQPQQSVVKSLEVLSYMKTAPRDSLFVLLDFHPYLSDAVHVRHLKDFALTYARHYSHAVLLRDAFPAEIEFNHNAVAAKPPKTTLQPCFSSHSISCRLNNARTAC